MYIYNSLHVCYECNPMSAKTAHHCKVCVRAILLKGSKQENKAITCRICG